MEQAGEAVTTAEDALGSTLAELPDLSDGLAALNDAAKQLQAAQEALDAAIAEESSSGWEEEVEAAQQAYDQALANFQQVSGPVLADLDATGTILETAAAQAQQAEDLLSTESSEADALGALLEDLDEALQAEEDAGDNLSEALSALSDAADSAFAAAGDVSSAYDALQDEASTVGGLEGDLDYAQEEYRVAEQNYENCLAQASDSEVQHQPPDCNEAELRAQVERLEGEQEQAKARLDAAFNAGLTTLNTTIPQAETACRDAAQAATRALRDYSDKVAPLKIAIAAERAALAATHVAIATEATTGVALVATIAFPPLVLVDVVLALAAVTLAEGGREASEAQWEVAKDTTIEARRQEWNQRGDCQAALAAAKQANNAQSAAITNQPATMKAYLDANKAYMDVTAKLWEAQQALNRCQHAGKQ